MGDQSINLKDLYKKAKDQIKDLEDSTLRGDSEEYQNKVADVLKSLDQCQEFVHKLSLFSENETIEDYGNAEIRFLMIPRLQASMLSKLRGDRMVSVEKSKLKLLEFIEKLIDLEIVNDEDVKYFEDVKRGVKPDAVKLRELKITRFKSQMALKKELKEVQSMLDGMKELDDELEDDELERKCLIKTLELEVKVCIDDLAATMEEIELIKHFEKIKVNTGDEQANKEEKVDSTWRLDGGLHGKKLLDGKGKPLKTFTLTNDRKTITKNVFRPGYSLPTKTIDEFLEDEFKRGGVITSSNNGPEIDPDEDDNDEELKDNDAELYKQRNWDDFKDDTPRGSGNRTNHG